MRRIFAVIAVLVCAGMSFACAKKTVPSPDSPRPVTVIVMDTAQSLLHDACVLAGKDTFRTSFDGRVVFLPGQLAGVKKLKISCAGYKPQTVAMSEADPLIVRLARDKHHPHHEAYEAESSGGMLYRSTPAVGKAAVKPSAAYEMAVLGLADGASTDAVAAAGNGGASPKGYAVAEDEADITAGKLTAGEVNDFTKWYFWPTVLDSTHKAFADTWRIVPRHRYTVQVMNKSGFPVASRAVSLTDPNGNTIYQAVTDNTGKAELWYQLTGRQLCGKHADFLIRVDDKTQPAKEWRDGINTFVTDDPCEPSGAVDVLFVFDATGSMGDELRYLREEMKDVISRAAEATGGLTIRTGAVVYRDHGDEYITRVSRLTEEIATTQEFIEKQDAGGGGDYPEAVPEALMAALNSTGWDGNARARIAFLILDAPCHEDSATLALLHEQLLNAAATGVRIVPVVCSGVGESGEYLLRSMALATNGTSFFLTDDSGIGQTHIKPVTDSLKVEHLNDMLVRTIVEFSTMPECVQTENGGQNTDDIEPFVPDPFDPQELEADPFLPQGEGVHYLLDVSGKLLCIYEGEIQTGNMPAGVYFIKTFYNGMWHTEKILVQ